MIIASQNEIGHLYCVQGGIPCSLHVFIFNPKGNFMR